ncbi:molybdopterin-dependent oxidoreductase, partial [Paenibacillus sp. IB182496]
SGPHAGLPTLRPWLRIGRGAAIAMHGAGLGRGIPDPAGGRLTLAPDGRIEAAFGYEECGQGLLATLEQMLVEQLGVAVSDLRLIVGDTDLVPDSGSSTASRATSMLYQTLRAIGPAFAARLLERAGQALRRPAGELALGAGGIRLRTDPEGGSEEATEEAAGEPILSYGELARMPGEAIRCEAALHYPVTPDRRTGAHYLYTYAAVAVRVEVDLRSGRVRVLGQHHVVAAGPVANPQGYLGQIEGGSGMAHGFALGEDARMAGGVYAFSNFDGYLIPTIADLSGETVVEAIEALPPGDLYGPRGVGEIGSVALAPAIAAAIHDATGIRVSRLPVEPELLQRLDWLGKGERA